jgi:hypothetical protein
MLSCLIVIDKFDHFENDGLRTAIKTFSDFLGRYEAISCVV